MFSVVLTSIFRLHASFLLCTKFNNNDTCWGLFCCSWVIRELQKELLKVMLPSSVEYVMSAGVMETYPSSITNLISLHVSSALNA